MEFYRHVLRLRIAIVDRSVNDHQPGSTLNRLRVVAFPFSRALSRRTDVVRINERDIFHRKVEKTRAKGVSRAMRLRQSRPRMEKPTWSRVSRT